MPHHDLQDLKMKKPPMQLQALEISSKSAFLQELQEASSSNQHQQGTKNNQETKLEGWLT